MQKVLLNVLILIIGIVVGMLVNAAFIKLGTLLIPLPEGVDPMNAENWKYSYFIFPFLAHALGTFSGAFFVAKLARSHQFILAQIIGIFFLAAGIFMVFIIPAPLWFVIADLGLAYITMSMLAAKIAQ
jgi:uncharacterized membrane protein YqgA involved in biofilm formation